PKEPDGPSAALPKPKTEQEARMQINGSARDEQGRPLAQVDVAALVWAKGRGPNGPSGEDADPAEVAARGQTDDAGRFRLTVPCAPEGLRLAAVVAGKPGYGLAWHSVALKDAPAEVALCLEREQPLHIQLHDLQGQPAAGVPVHVVAV